MQNADPGQTWRGSCSEGAGEGGRGGGGSGAAQKNASNRSRGVPPPRSTLRDLDAIKRMAILRLTTTHKTNSRAWNAPFLRHRQDDSRWQIFHTGLPYQKIGSLSTSVFFCLFVFFHWKSAPCRASPEGGSVSTGNNVPLFAPTVRHALFSPNLTKEPEKKQCGRKGGCELKVGNHHLLGSSEV